MARISPICARVNPHADPTLALDTGLHGIRVNLVSPGPVRGQRLDWVIEKNAETAGISTGRAREEFVAQSRLSRLVEPGHVADAVVFLASDNAAAITRADLNSRRLRSSRLGAGDVLSAATLGTRKAGLGRSLRVTRPVHATAWLLLNTKCLDCRRLIRTPHALTAIEVACSAVYSPE